MATATAAGAVFGMIQPFNPGSHYDLISRLLSIIVLGGLGSLGGAIVAALFMGVAESVFAAEISPTWSSFMFFIVLIAILLFRPQGLFGSSSEARCEPRRRRAGARAVVFGALIAFPFVFAQPWLVNIGLFTLMYAGLATSWNLLGGYSGYLSLGHAAFFGLGAYADRDPLHAPLDRPDRLQAVPVLPLVGDRRRR